MNMRKKDLYRAFRCIMLFYIKCTLNFVFVHILKLNGIMAITKEVIRQCLQSKREEIENADVVFRPFEFEEVGNYVFVGVRHVGKSYMMYQRVKQLLSEGVGWDEILFVDFEDERLAEADAMDLNLFLETHLEAYGKKPYIFLDEVQNVEHWEKFVRRLANSKYRLYITGSNAKMLSKDVATTLGGRFFIVDVYPYSFQEYLAVNDVHPSSGWEYSTLERSKILRMFNEYFYYGGLPEVHRMKSKRAMLSNLYQKIYLADICQRNSIKNDKVLNILIKKMAESVKQPLSFNKLKNTVVSTGSTISVPTTIDYVGYAMDSWLILPVENELAKLGEKESLKKYYFVDNGLLNLFLIYPETSLLENMVAVQLCRKYGKENVSYYKADKEIDFIVADAHLAIQVSYSIKDADTYERETIPLVHFAKTHKEWECLIITFEEKNSLEREEVKIEVIPVWKWLLDL